MSHRYVFKKKPRSRSESCRQRPMISCRVGMVLVRPKKKKAKKLFPPHPPTTHGRGGGMGGGDAPPLASKNLYPPLELKIWFVPPLLPSTPPLQREKEPFWGVLQILRYSFPPLEKSRRPCVPPTPE